jgi:anaerobic selenocysteine-containing dehydrogenase
VASEANRKTVIAGLEAAELVITQDVFADTETNAYADVVLPATLWAESDGVMVNSERNLTLVQGVIDSPGQALPDWQLIARVACAKGFADAFTYSCSELGCRPFQDLRRLGRGRESLSGGRLAHQANEPTLALTPLTLQRVPLGGITTAMPQVKGRKHRQP